MMLLKNRVRNFGMAYALLVSAAPAISALPEQSLIHFPIRISKAPTPQTFQTPEPTSAYTFETSEPTHRPRRTPAPTYRHSRPTPEPTWRHFDIPTPEPTWRHYDIPTPRPTWMSYDTPRPTPGAYQTPAPTHKLYDVPTPYHENAPTPKHNTTPPTILLEMKVSGGFVNPEHQGYENGIRVMSNGKVIHFDRASGDAPETKKRVLRLNAQQVQNIKTELETLSTTDSVQYSDSDPICADAPDTTYSAPQHRSEPFATNINCRNGFVESFAYAHELKDLMQGLANLPLN